jgi:acetyltransferase
MNKSPCPTPAAGFPDANHPDPEKLGQIVTAKGYGKLKIRAIRPDDEKGMVQFHQCISEESIYLRYFEHLGVDQRTAHERLSKICANTPESYAIVVVEPAATALYPEAILAVGRLTRTSEPNVVSYDTLIADEENAPQLGKIVLHQLVELARDFGFQILTSELLIADHDALTLTRGLGFSHQTLPLDGLVRVTLHL